MKFYDNTNTLHDSYISAVRADVSTLFHHLHDKLFHKDDNSDSIEKTSDDNSFDIVDEEI